MPSRVARPATCELLQRGSPAFVDESLSSSAWGRAARNRLAGSHDRAVRNNSVPKASASTRGACFCGVRISAARSRSSGVACAPVRAEVAVVKQIGWWVSASRTQKGLRAILDGLSDDCFLRESHLPLAVAALTMRIDDQHFSSKITASEPKFSQRHLQSLSVVHGARRQEFWWTTRHHRPRAADPLTSPESITVRQGSIVAESPSHKVPPHAPSAQGRAAVRFAPWTGRSNHTASPTFPTRRCSATSSHSPTRLPLTFSANNCHARPARCDACRIAGLPAPCGSWCSESQRKSVSLSPLPPFGPESVWSFWREGRSRQSPARRSRVPMMYPSLYS